MVRHVEASLAAACEKLGAKLQFVDVSSVGELQSVVARLVREGVDAAILQDFSLFEPHLEQIAALFIDHRLPTLDYAPAGFLLHYYAGSGRQFARNAAAYVDKILKGAKPVDLPVEQTTRTELVVNGGGALDQARDRDAVSARRARVREAPGGRARSRRHARAGGGEDPASSEGAARQAANRASRRFCSFSIAAPFTQGSSTIDCLPLTKTRTMRATGAR